VSGINREIRERPNRSRRDVLSAFATSAVIGLIGASAAACLHTGLQSDLARLGPTFVSETALVNGARIHYVRGGSGPPLFLLHGFPQDWYAWHKVVPRLAAHFTVVAPDMRGVGGSSGPVDLYDPQTLVSDVQELAAELGFETITVAGHDNGAMLAYAFALSNPQLTRAVFILDCPIPGVEPWEHIKKEPDLWHFGFHQTPGLPERLVQGRQAAYFRSFFDRLALDRTAVSDEDVAHYAAAYASSAQLRAGFEFYRQSYPGIEQLSAARAAPGETPIILVGGEHSLGAVNPAIAHGLRALGWRSVTVDQVAKSGHWLMDEQPDGVVDVILRHTSSASPTAQE
jgi:pimeloyl-ACP methyl ester carboxylesterase